MGMARQGEARYARDFGGSRDDLSPDVRAVYDQLLSFRAEHPSSPLPVLPSDVYIKRTGWNLFVRIFSSTALCFLLAGIVTAMGGTFWIFLVIFWLPGIALVLVFHQTRLTTAGNVLTYQVPLLHPQSWQREEIAAFGLDQRWSVNLKPGHMTHLIMDTMVDGQVAFRAIEASLWVERDELYGWVAALQDWLMAANDQSRD